MKKNLFAGLLGTAALSCGLVLAVSPAAAADAFTPSDSSTSSSVIAPRAGGNCNYTVIRGSYNTTVAGITCPRGVRA